MFQTFLAFVLVVCFYFVLSKISARGGSASGGKSQKQEIWLWSAAAGLAWFVLALVYLFGYAFDYLTLAFLFGFAVLGFLDKIINFLPVTEHKFRKLLAGLVLLVSLLFNYLLLNENWQGIVFLTLVLILLWLWSKSRRNKEGGSCALPDRL